MPGQSMIFFHLRQNSASRKSIIISMKNFIDSAKFPDKPGIGMKPIIVMKKKIMGSRHNAIILRKKMKGR